MEDESSFFERERDRLSTEIVSGFEELLSSSNALNRKLEEVLGMTREYETIAALWQSFHELMRGHDGDDGAANAGSTSGGDAELAQGLPGTGGHVLGMSTAARSTGLGPTGTSD